MNPFSTKSEGVVGYSSYHTIPPGKKVRTPPVNIFLFYKIQFYCTVYTLIIHSTRFMNIIWTLWI